MKVKALVNFVGDLCMSIDDVKDINDEKAKKLIDIGYVEAFDVSTVSEKTEIKEQKKRRSTKKAVDVNAEIK